MKWIKTRQHFLNEAKIRDVIFSRQAKEVADAWGEKYLDYEEITPTDKIKQGRWKLSDEDKMKVLSELFKCDMEEVMKVFEALPDKFCTLLSESIKEELLNNDQKLVLDNFNIKTPTIDQIVFSYQNAFRKLDINPTRASSTIQKDENGRPIRDENGDMLRISKNPGDPIFTNNLVNLVAWAEDYNTCYPDDEVDIYKLRSNDILSLINFTKSNENPDYKYEYAIYGKDMYLQIDHNPTDILNMSISKFYASCQHLYEGGHREQLLGNVFDPNSIPAFLVFDSPIYWEGQKISDKLPISRMMIRNIETYDDSVDAKIYFDRSYPDRMKSLFDDLVKKYSNNNQNIGKYDYSYIFTPDIEYDDNLIENPYMDNLGVSRKKMIGINAKTVYFSSIHDWSKVKIAPNAKIKELIIETTDIPDQILEMKLDLDWIKFKNLIINDIKGFNKIKTDSIAFDRCKFNSEIIKEISLINKDIKKLQIVSCDVPNDLDIKSLENLEELQLIYTFDSTDDINRIIEGSNIKKLVLSGDLAGKESKEFINDLKSKGIKIETVGPVI